MIAAPFYNKFSENVVVAKTSYHMLEIWLYSDRVREGFTSFNGTERTNFCGEKSIMKLSGVSILENRQEKLKLNVVLESKAL